MVVINNTVQNAINGPDHTKAEVDADSYLITFRKKIANWIMPSDQNQDKPESKQEQREAGTAKNG